MDPGGRTFQAGEQQVQEPEAAACVESFGERSRARRWAPSGRRPEGSTVQDGAGRRDDIAEEPEGGGSLRRAVMGNIA